MKTFNLENQEDTECISDILTKIEKRLSEMEEALTMILYGKEK